MYKLASFGLLLISALAQTDAQIDQLLAGEITQAEFDALLE
jgi:hypothetical protein